MDIDRIYAVETTDYNVTIREIELSCPVSANSSPTEYKTKAAVNLDPYQATNTIPASKMKCVLSLQSNAHQPYHIIAFFPHKEDADEYLKIAKDMRNKRLDDAIIEAKSQLDKLTSLRKELSAPDAEQKTETIKVNG